MVGQSMPTSNHRWSMIGDGDDRLSRFYDERRSMIDNRWIDDDKRSCMMDDDRASEMIDDRWPTSDYLLWIDRSMTTIDHRRSLGDVRRRTEDCILSLRNNPSIDDDDQPPMITDDRR